MKKIVLAILVSALSLPAQNLQVHYELDKDREYFVTTLEMFKPDEYGSTFWFVDMNYDADNVKSASLAYWEIARSISLPVNNLSLNLEYNDGLDKDFGAFGQNWLVGLSYFEGNSGLPLTVSYKWFHNAGGPDFQFTTAWAYFFLDDKIEFSGFVDVWTQDKVASDGKSIVMLSEPQLWYQANAHLSVGGEVEISHHFPTELDDFSLAPTFGLRWNF